MIVAMMTVEDLPLLVLIPTTIVIVTAHRRTVVEVAVAAEVVPVPLPATVVKVTVLLVDTRTRVDTMTIVETLVIAEIVVEDVTSPGARRVSPRT